MSIEEKGGVEQIRSMDHYQTFARKFRPQTFLDVVGQQVVVTTLKNAIRMNRTSHAYLFCGSRGTGKTTLARLFAKALNCPSLSQELEPCNCCPSCKDIAASRAIDVLEIDGASHRGIEDIRQINETVAFSPSGGHYKIYIIDEVHMLTKEAFNALLKTLEEPPPHAKFFFCTTEPHKIPSTILSRCQRFNLNRLSIEELEKRLDFIAKNSDIQIAPEALILLAKRAEGSLRDALSLLDQIVAFEKEHITPATVRKLLTLAPAELFITFDKAGHDYDLMAAFKLSEEVFSSGINFSYFFEELASHYRMLLLYKQGACTEKIYQLPSSFYTSDQLIYILEIIIEGAQTIKTAPSERCALEIVLLKIIQSHKKISLESLVDRLVALEDKLSCSEQEAPPKSSSSGCLGLNNLPSQQEQSRFDTVMRFAAKELNGFFKKEA